MNTFMGIAFSLLAVLAAFNRDTTSFYNSMFLVALFSIAYELQKIREKH